MSGGVACDAGGLLVGQAAPATPNEATAKPNGHQYGLARQNLIFRCLLIKCAGKMPALRPQWVSPHPAQDRISRFQKRSLKIGQMVGFTVAVCDRTHGPYARGFSDVCQVAIYEREHVLRGGGSCPPGPSNMSHSPPQAT